MSSARRAARAGVGPVGARDPVVARADDARARDRAARASASSRGRSSAGALAALVYPGRGVRSRAGCPRGVVVFLLVVVGLGAIGFVGYRIVNDVTSATDRIQQAAPKRAAELEKNSEFLRTVHLRRRVQNLVDDIPNRLAGRIGARRRSSRRRRAASRSSPGSSSRSSSCSTGRGCSTAASTRSATPKRRGADRARRASAGPGAGSTTRGSSCSRRSIGGVLAYVIARAAGVPGPAALGVWAGALDAAAGRGRVRRRAPDRRVRGRVVGDARGRRRRCCSSRSGSPSTCSTAGRRTRDRRGRLVPDRARRVRRPGALRPHRRAARRPRRRSCSSRSSTRYAREEERGREPLERGHSTPRMTVLADENQPPVPLTQHSFAFST